MTASVTRVIIDKNVAGPMRDGVILRADVWRPDDDSPRPAIVERTPYQKERAVSNDFLRPDSAAEAGFAVVLQDTRGRFASDGDWDGFDWEQEALDTVDTLEWVAQQPWCDGRVALRGVSYPGLLTWQGIASGSPHLYAAAPAMAVGTTGGGAAETGTAPLELITNWFLMQLATDVIPAQQAAGTLRPETVQRMRDALARPGVLVDHLPLRENPYLQLPGTPVDIDDMLQSDPIGFPGVDLEVVDTPTLLTSGWFDASVDGTFAIFDLLRQRSTSDRVRRGHQLVVGPWVHALQLPATQGELALGLQAVGRPVVQAAHLDFFSAQLNDEVEQKDAITYFVIGANEWRTSDQWPPAGVEEQVWFLDSGGHANTAAGDGVLSLTPSVGTSAFAAFDYDPQNPVRSHGGDIVPIGESPAGPLNQAHIESRADVLCFTCPVLEESCELLGPVWVRLHVATDVPSTDFSVRLVDVTPDGRSILICKGILRLNELTGEEVREIVVPLGQTAWRLQSGHRLRLHVTSSDFPHHDRNMNTGLPLGVDVSGPVAHHRVFHDTERRSLLAVHIAPFQKVTG